MKKATFYVIPTDNPQAKLEGLLTFNLLEHSLFLAKHFADQGAKVYLQAQDKNQAEQLDELLWQQAEDYPPHNLIGEGPYYGTPIEIGYFDTKDKSNSIVFNNTVPNNIAPNNKKLNRPNRNRQLFINLAINLDADEKHNLTTNEKSNLEQNNSTTKAVFTQSSFAPNLVQVIDFVPCETQAKQDARERYKLYRQAGFELETIELK